MPLKLLQPNDVLARLTRRFENQHRNWLKGEGEWPLRVALGLPTQEAASLDAESLRQVRSWVGEWEAWPGPGDVQWEERQWKRWGAQRLPAVLELSSATDVAAAAGQKKRWQTATRRFQLLIARWPVLADNDALASRFDVLADYAEDDFQRLIGLLAWVQEHPHSNVYLRQLPVPGLDTKWIHPRRSLAAGLARVLLGEMEADFETLCGLKSPAPRMRVRILCPQLRKCVGGLTDIEAPVEELAALAVAPTYCLVVENLETGLALPDLVGTLCVMKLGAAVGLLSELPWVRAAKVLYWGDLDSHGFSILAKARTALPQTRSLLMDQATLLAHRDLWVQEKVPCTETELPTLTAEETATFEGLRTDRWGACVRLEQERIAWDYAMERLHVALCRH